MPDKGYKEIKELLDETNAIKASQWYILLQMYQWPQIFHRKNKLHIRIVLWQLTLVQKILNNWIICNKIKSRRYVYSFILYYTKHCIFQIYTIKNFFPHNICVYNLYFRILKVCNLYFKIMKRLFDSLTDRCITPAEYAFNCLRLQLHLEILIYNTC